MRTAKKVNKKDDWFAEICRWSEQVERFGKDWSEKGKHKRFNDERLPPFPSTPHLVRNSAELERFAPSADSDHKLIILRQHWQNHTQTENSAQSFQIQMVVKAVASLDFKTLGRRSLCENALCCVTDEFQKKTGKTTTRTQ